MAQHDYVIANGTGAAVRSDLNNGLSAIVTQNSGATEPATTYAFMRWADTTAGVMKMRNSANNAWITLYQLDGEWTNIAFENGTAAAPSIYFKDSGTDTGFYSPGANQVGISTGGTARLTIDSNGNVDIDSNTLYVDATNNRVGLGTSSPGDYNSNANTLVVGNTSSNQGITISAGTASASAIHFADGTAGDASYRGILKYEHSNDRFLFGTAGGNTALTIDSSQRVGIGTTSVVGLLSLDKGNVSNRGQWSDCALAVYNPTNLGSYSQIGFGYASSQTYASAYLGFISTSQASSGKGDIVIGTRDVTTDSQPSEKLRLTSDGKLLVGTSSSAGIGGFGQSLIQTKGDYQAGAQFINTENNSNSLAVTVGKVRGTSIVQNGDPLGHFNFVGWDGVDTYVMAAHIKAEVDGTPGNDDMPGRLVFSTTADGASSPTIRLTIKADGAFRDATGIYGDYSGASANLCIDSTGHITRGSSSIRYKTQVEDLEDQYADALLECRPVWYRSTSKNDNPDWSFYGLIAEEVAEIDPRLVQWRTTNPVVQEDGTLEHVPCDPVPEGISYDRFVPHLLNLIKRQKEQIEAMEARLSALEAS
jgi:hypothetical protein